MKKIFSLLLALTCAAGTMYAGYGRIPDKKYCKWGDNFRFDHAFKFHNAGAHNEKMKVMCKQRSGAFKQEQYDKAIEKSSRVREVMSVLSDARAKMAAVSQYDLDGLKAFYDSTKYGDGKLYKGFSKGEIERLLKTYNGNKKNRGRPTLDT